MERVALAPEAKISVTRYLKGVTSSEPDVWVGTVAEAVGGRKFENVGDRLDIVASVVAGSLAGCLVFERFGNVYARA